MPISYRVRLPHLLVNRYMLSGSCVRFVYSPLRMDRQWKCGFASLGLASKNGKIRRGCTGPDLPDSVLQFLWELELSTDTVARTLASLTLGGLEEPRAQDSGRLLELEWGSFCNVLAMGPWQKSGSQLLCTDSLVLGTVAKLDNSRIGR